MTNASDPAVQQVAKPILSYVAGERARLDDGRSTTLIRTGHQDDVAVVRALHHRLSQDSIRSRYFCARTVPQPGELGRRLLADPDRGALVAVVGSTVVGLAEIARVGPTTAEVALLVDDAHQGRGIGTLLLQRLVRAAAAHGIETLLGETLHSNARMRRVLLRSGLGSRLRHQEETLQVTFPLNVCGEGVPNRSLPPDAA